MLKLTLMQVLLQYSQSTGTGVDQCQPRWYEQQYFSAFTYF